jgi:beta-lactamase class D
MRIVPLVIACLLAGCSPGAPPGPATAAVAQAQAPAPGEGLPESPDAAFVCLDLKRGTYTRSNARRCAGRMNPFSTFKIPNTLIGLETGVLDGAETFLKWDPAHDPVQARFLRAEFGSWKRDQTLRTAIRDSVLWYFQKLALRVGTERYRRYLRAFNYGNADPSSGIETFWLDGSLKISADEQVEFLRRLYSGALPVSARSRAILVDVMPREEGDGWKLYAKTGGGYTGRGAAIGWYVGWVERGDDVFIFAANVDGESYSAVRDRRIAVAKAGLRTAGALPGRSE